MHPWGRGGVEGTYKNSMLISIGPRLEQTAATFESDSEITIHTYVHNVLGASFSMSSGVHY